MNMMEIYAAWCETFFQLFYDPAGAVQKPEVGQILAKSKGAIMKMLMTCGMTYAMTVVVVVAMTVFFMTIFVVVVAVMLC